TKPLRSTLNVDGTARLFGRPTNLSSETGNVDSTKSDFAKSERTIYFDTWFHVPSFRCNLSVKAVNKVFVNEWSNARIHTALHGKFCCRLFVNIRPRQNKLAEGQSRRKLCKVITTGIPSWWMLRINQGPTP